MCQPSVARIECLVLSAYNTVEKEKVHSSSDHWIYHTIEEAID